MLAAGIRLQAGAAAFAVEDVDLGRLPIVQLLVRMGVDVNEPAIMPGGPGRPAHKMLTARERAALTGAGGPTRPGRDPPVPG